MGRYEESLALELSDVRAVFRTEDSTWKSTRQKMNHVVRSPKKVVDILYRGLPKR